MTNDVLVHDGKAAKRNDISNSALDPVVHKNVVEKTIGVAPGEIRLRAMR